jgi:RimJ/RimL family protein N-acetyltransferase
MNRGSSACVLLPILQWMYEDYLRETSYQGRGFLCRLRLLTDAEGQIVGFCAPTRRGKYHRLGHLYIAPAYRGRGLASGALRDFCAEHKHVEWWAPINDTRSQHIAEKCLTLVDEYTSYKIYRK